MARSKTSSQFYQNYFHMFELILCRDEKKTMHGLSYRISCKWPQIVIVVRIFSRCIKNNMEMDNEIIIRMSGLWLSSPYFRLIFSIHSITPVLV